MKKIIIIKLITSLDFKTPFLHRNKSDDASTDGKTENKEVNRVFS